MLLFIVLVGNIYGDILQPAIQYLAELIECMSRNRHILLQALDSRMAHPMFEAQRVRRSALCRHCFPKRSIANHNVSPFTGFIMTAIMAI